LVRLERIWETRNRMPVLLVSGATIVIAALVDWQTNAYLSLGFLYLFPIMFVAAHAPRWVVVFLAAGCAGLAEAFSSLAPSLVRSTFETLALASSGLFVAELRNGPARLSGSRT
jgi:hypothetical protein